MSVIAENYLRVKERIHNAANRSGIRHDVSLVLVVKTVSPENIQEVVNCGGKILGENRVQVAKEKIPQIIGNSLEWHMIGRLQKNKVNAALHLFSMIQSIDSTELACAVNSSAKRLGMNSIDCMLQVNIGHEKTKAGILPEELMDKIHEVESLKRLNIRGIMAIPPFHEEPERSRQYFMKMKKLWDSARSIKLDNISMDYLSMGMSNDFEIAIEEGANMVRVGSMIFGERL